MPSPAFLVVEAADARGIFALPEYLGRTSAAMAFSFLQRGNLADHAKQLQLTQYSPEIVLEGLLTGVDNVRTDVYLSPKFADVTRQHIAKLLAKYGSVEDFLVEDSFSRTVASAAAAPQGRYVTGGFIGSPKAATAL